MNILGPDSLVFGVDDVAACVQYFTDFGLMPLGVTASGGRFEALDGTSVVIARRPPVRSLGDRFPVFVQLGCLPQLLLQ